MLKTIFFSEKQPAVENNIFLRKTACAKKGKEERTQV